MMRQHILTAALLAVSMTAFGQNLNPTVEVTNTYEGGAGDIVKPELRMNIPDSVMKFNLDFDYSVFEHPYKGAYEFRPYMVQLRPQARPSTENRFYLRAGAGFSLHPEVLAVWTPYARKGWKVNVYADHRSFFGRYRGISPSAMATGWSLKDDGSRHTGYDALTKAGVNGSRTWSSGVADLDVAYGNRLAKDPFVRRAANSVDITARVRSQNPSERYFYYDATVKYRYLDDSGATGASYAVDEDAYESFFDADGTFGVVVDGKQQVLTDIGALVERQGIGGKERFTGNIYAAPHYQFVNDAWHFDLGVKVSALFHDGDGYGKASGFLFPAVHVDYRMLEDRLVLQAAATGGDKVNTYGDVLARNPFFCLSRWEADNSVELLRAMVGVRGKVTNLFQYDLRLGYAREAHALMDALYDVGGGTMVPGLGYADYDLLYAELLYGWKSNHIEVDGRLDYGWSDCDTRLVFAPAAFTGHIRAAYNWGARLKAGFDLSGSSSRTAPAGTVDYTLPGYVDLGLFGEFGLNDTLSVWGKVGNLLNQTIQRTPYHAEQGLYLTAGLCLHF